MKPPVIHTQVGCKQDSKIMAVQSKMDEPGKADSRRSRSDEKADLERKRSERKSENIKGWGETLREFPHSIFA